MSQSRRLIAICAVLPVAAWSAGCAPHISRVDIAAIRDVRLEALRVDRLALQLDLELRGAARDVRVTDVQVAFGFDTRLFARGTVAGPLHVSRGSPTPLTLALDMDPADLRSADLEALCGDQVPYRVRGTLGVATSGAPRRATIDATGIIRRSGRIGIDLPASSFEHSDLLQVSATPADWVTLLRGRADVPVTVRNPFPFPVPLDELRVEINQGETRLGTGTLGNRALAPGPNALILPVTVSRAGAGLVLAQGTMGRLLNRSPDPLTIAGVVELGPADCLEVRFAVPAHLGASPSNSSR